MGDPFVEDEEKDGYLRNISQEIISAMSSLNMDPRPTDNENNSSEETEQETITIHYKRPKHKESDDVVFLTELDEWAKHAYKHLKAAMMAHRGTEDRLNKASSQLWHIIYFFDTFKDNLPEKERKLLKKMLDRMHDLLLASVQNPPDYKGLYKPGKRIIECPK